MANEKYYLTRTGFSVLRGDIPEAKELLTPPQVMVLRGLSGYRRGTTITTLMQDGGYDPEDEQLRSEISDILFSLSGQGYVSTRGAMRPGVQEVMEYPEHKLKPLSTSMYHLMHGEKRRAYLPLGSAFPLPWWEPEPGEEIEGVLDTDEGNGHER